jgi:hypothetical protein
MGELAVPIGVRLDYRAFEASRHIEYFGRAMIADIARNLDKIEIGALPVSAACARKRRYCGLRFSSLGPILSR